MKRKVLFVLLVICNSYLFAQTNVGIGTTTPTEKLDVNGNINVQGTIKANGVAGQNNQVLMTNSSGNMAWVDMCQYKNFIGFSFPGSSPTWMVPTGVTKILVEAWGGGGSGAAGGGGGGGGYVQAIFSVTPGENLSIYVGAGSMVNNGENSTVTCLAGTAYAYGGNGASTISAGSGGVFGASGASFYGFYGENGHNATEKYEQSGTSSFIKTTYYGYGGNGANTNNTAGRGDSRAVDATTLALIKLYGGKTGVLPGGGGGGNGFGGGPGMVIIRY